VQKIVEITKNRSLLEEFNSVKGSKNQQAFENFARQVAMVVASVVKGNLRVIEEVTDQAGDNQAVAALREATKRALEMMVQLSNVPEDELFKICLDFWHHLCVEIQNNPRHQRDQATVVGMDFYGVLHGSFMSSQVYPEVLAQVEQIMVDCMVKPKEVLVVIDDNGEAVEEVFDDTETISVYETMRETLVYLTNIDKVGVDRVIQSRLDRITQDKSYFSFDRLNKLCWALGSISGCMSPDEESKFVVTVIKELLNLCEKTSGKSNKALVAADIMYVVGQFPRFLCGHWAFLKTVIKKLNEFMHEKHPGVQDMASETFLKIAKLTRHMFISRNDYDKEPYVNDLIRQIPENQKDLEQHQKLMVYEGIGHMINAEQNPLVQESLVINQLQYVDFEWKQILVLANQDANQLMIPEVVKSIDFILKVNTRVAESVGYTYLSYLRQIFVDLLKMYGLYSQCISNSVKQR
jgi:exportin-1